MKPLNLALIAAGAVAAWFIFRRLSDDAAADAYERSISKPAYWSAPPGSIA